MTPPRPLSRLLNRVILLWLVLPGLFAIFILGVFGLHRMIDNFASDSKVFASSIVRYVEVYLDDAFSHLEAVETQYAALSKGSDKLPLSMLSFDPHFHKIMLVNDQGRILASSPSGDEGEHFGLDFDAGGADRLILSRPVPSQETGSLVLYIGRRIEGGLLLAGELDLEAFQRHLSALLVPGKGSLIITDAFGNLITHPDMRRVMTQDNIGGDALFRKADQGGQLILVRDQHSHSLLVASAWPTSLTGWRIFLIKPLADVAKPAFMFLGALLAAVLLFFCALALFLRLSLNRHIVLPLASFAEAMRSLARGEQETSTPHQASSQELLRVFYSFRAMALRVRKRERELTASRERFRQLVENMEEIFSIMELPSGKLTYVSPAVKQILGPNFAKLGMRPWDCLDMVHHEDAQRLRNSLERSGWMGVQIEEEFRVIQPPHGEARWMRLRAYPVRDASGKVGSLVGFLQDITDKRRMDEALRHMVRATAAPVGEEFFAAMAQHLAEALETSHALIGTYTDTPPTRAMPLAFWGRGRPLRKEEYSLQDTPCGLVAQKGVALVQSGLSEAFPRARTLQNENLESFLGVTLHDSHGKPIGHIAVMDEKPLLDEARARSVLTIFSARVASEIERRAALSSMEASLAEKEILLKEVHHRVKNNLQVVSSLMSLQASSKGNPELTTLLTESRNRVQAMALVHEEIYKSTDLARIDLSRYLRHLLNILLANMSNGRAVTLRLDIQDISLPVNLAVPCGLIINELFTNALKHAFANHDRGEVRIDMSRNEDGLVTLTLRDDGVGFPPDLDFRATETLGMQLVVSLVRQLDGSIDLLPGPGTAFAIRFQAGQAVAEQPLGHMNN
ncbi:PAS domain S-box [Desulfocurvibacter africanus PCS]|uniref:histidine kinase n=1 Tax=Desulfocurvibacter africanus PCS TaxID=1262666 RepID=M5Q112_DESAF|nr:histidine kinase dimerization/phosphoacceptor domain -containing protein [Desulfocurvibacter africanus]EMG36148.1 PAS domain S-box [Desulfocurvibacter africanus PCS]